MLPQGKIKEGDLRLFQITDSPAEVVEIMKQSQSTIVEVAEDFYGAPSIEK